MLTSKEIAHLAVKALDDKLARDIQILKTDKVTVLADYFILCTAGNSTHGKTLADEVDKVLSQAGEQPLRREVLAVVAFHQLNADRPRLVRDACREPFVERRREKRRLAEPGAVLAIAPNMT